MESDGSPATRLACGQGACARRAAVLKETQQWRKLIEERRTGSTRKATAKFSPARQMGHIYQLLFPNGKSYVGQTLRWKRRMNEHRRGAKSEDGHAIKRAIRKHGWASVSVRCLATVTKEELDSAEVQWIAAIGSLAPAGYNLTVGGDAQPMDHPEVRKWQKERIGEAMRSSGVRAKKRALWKDAGYRRMQHEKRTGSEAWMQARVDCQNTAEINEKRRVTWARKRAEKVAGMGVDEGREFMRRGRISALRLARQAAKRIAGHSDRDPVAETKAFWDKEIAGYEATVWCVPGPPASSAKGEESASGAGGYETEPEA